MSATVRIDLYSEPAYNPMDIWHKRDSMFTYLYPDDLDKFIDVVESICLDFLPVLKGGDSYAFACLVCDSSGSSPLVIGDGRRSVMPLLR